MIPALEEVIVELREEEAQGLKRKGIAAQTYKNSTDKLNIKC